MIINTFTACPYEQDAALYAILARTGRAAAQLLPVDEELLRMIRPRKPHQLPTALSGSAYLPEVVQFCCNRDSTGWQDARVARALSPFLVQSKIHDYEPLAATPPKKSPKRPEFLSTSPAKAQ
jgi:hypothetical protein